MQKPSSPKIPARRSAAARAPRPIADEQPPADLAAAPAREGDDLLVVLLEQRVAESGRALRPGEVAVRQQPGQAPPAGLVPGEQDEPWPAGPRADAAEVLLDRIAMAGESGSLRSWPGRATILDPAVVEGGRP